MILAKIFHKKPTQSPPPQGSVTSKDLDPRIALHYGIPPTASILAFDPFQSLLAVGTLDGRIKVIGGATIEALLMSPKQLPFKNLEFLQNQGFLVSVSKENDIQVWEMEVRTISSTLHWECNITAFSIISGTTYMYIGDENGMVSVLKYDYEERKILQLSYLVPANSIAEVAGISLPDHHSVVGLLPQPCSYGNRLLIAYESGLIILWDVSEDRSVLVRGHKDLQLKNGPVVNVPKNAKLELSSETSNHEPMEKEISSLCWAAANGSVLAVGYVDGDILLWNTSNTVSTKDHQNEKSFINVVKLQLSSSNRKLPVIFLHCSANRSHNDHGCQLFVYGGDEIGSKEVLTILNLDWSSGIENLKCLGRVDLTLNGFADMVLLGSIGAMESTASTSLLVLTNPGQLHVYDDACLSALMSQQDKKTSVSAVEYPMVIPTVEPCLTVGKICSVYGNGSVPSEKVADLKLRAVDTINTGSTKWPLTGGVPTQLLDAEDYRVERVYVAGYQDGSVRIWDVTYPALSLIYVIGSEVKGIKITSGSASVSALDFCCLTLTLAIGSKCGLVHLHKLIGSSDEMSLHFVTETETEVHNLHQGDGPQCIAMFAIVNSPVCTLQFANFGATLAVGFECGRVAMLDISTLSVLFLTDCISNSSTPVVSLDAKSFSDPNSLNTPKDSESKSLNNTGKWPMFVLTKDAHTVVLDGTTGNVISSQSIQPTNESSVISMYIIEGSISVSELSCQMHSPNSSYNSENKSESAQTNPDSGSYPLEVECDTSTETTYFGQRLLDSCVLLCYEDALHLYSLKSLIQGDSSSICKVNLEKPCCWTTIFKKDEKKCGLVLLYQTGIIEIRSLPYLEVVGETSLMSILRWNFKTNMTKTMCSSDSGQIMLVNGCEFAFVSLLACENDFRIPESLPSLHDEVLAAATDASVYFSPNLKKQQDASPGILGGIIKGFKQGRIENDVHSTEVSRNSLAHLDSIFSRSPIFQTSTTTSSGQKVIQLNIDDIDIDELVSTSSSSQKSKNYGKDKKTERAKLFEGATTDMKPTPRTAEEIKAKYRKTGDASVAAAQAKDKLIERQEKLEKLKRNTEELQSGAENFATMASELAKTMENRKWWNI